jgi:hypothetical protein
VNKQLTSREEALAYHAEGRPGKIQVVPTKACRTQKDLCFRSVHAFSASSTLGDFYMQMHCEPPLTPLVRSSDVASSQGTGPSHAYGNVTDLNICEVPLFVSSSDLHLTSGSPCKDAGDDALLEAEYSTDLDGNGRRVGPVDMGCYEVQTP